MDNDCIITSEKDFNRHSAFLRFLCVGVLNTIFGYSVFVLFFYCGMGFVSASLLATCLGILFNFRTIGRLVFRNNDKKLFWRFLTVYAITYCLSIGLIELGTTVFINNVYLISALTTPITAMVAYLLNTYWVFQRADYATD